MQGWQPIETAPKDESTLVLAWRANGGNPPFWTVWRTSPRTGITCWDDPWEWDQSEESVDNPPTHWLPVPPPPGKLDYWTLAHQRVPMNVIR